MQFYIVNQREYPNKTNLIRNVFDSDFILYFLWKQEENYWTAKILIQFAYVGTLDTADPSLHLSPERSQLSGVEDRSQPSVGVPVEFWGPSTS